MSRDEETIDAMRADNEALRRRQAELESELDRRDRIIQALIDNIPGIVYVTDDAWTLRYINRQVAAMIGAAAAIVGRPDADFFPKEIVEKWHDNDRRMIESGAPCAEVEERGPHADGIHVHRSIKFPIRDDAGALFALGGISMDVTAQRRAEKQLRESEANAQSMIDASTDALLLVDATGAVIAANGAAALQNGRSIEELIGARDPFPFDDPARRTALLEEVSRTGRPLHFEEQRAGLVFDVALYPIMKDGALKRVSIFCRDMTERQRAEQEHKLLQKRIIDAQRAAIRELGMPIIPITTDTVVVPIVGAMDTIRAQQLMEALLSGVAARSAGMVIVDVTGAHTLDAQAAEALVRAARAVRLLGARVILTGISPDTAQALVTLGVDLEEIQTLGSLQDGISFALRRRGR